MELVAEYAERIVVMKQGRVLLDGPTAKVFLSTDKLNEAGIIPPLLSRLCFDLQKQGINVPPILTVSELKSFLRDHCHELRD